MTEPALIPVEQLEPGHHVFVTPRLGYRRVIDVLAYDTLGLEQVDCFVVLYQPPGPGHAWENRATAKGVATRYARDRAGLQPIRRGELVQIQPGPHLIERS